MMGKNVRQMLPVDKLDVAGAEALVALGYPAVAPVLPDLLEWLQDVNWPVSKPIGEFLGSVPEQMAPLIWDVLRGDDFEWKYNCIVQLVQEMPAHVAEPFRPELTRLAQQPTDAENSEGLDRVAKRALAKVWPDEAG